MRRGRVDGELRGNGGAEEGERKGGRERETYLIFEGKEKEKRAGGGRRTEDGERERAANEESKQAVQRSLKRCHLSISYDSFQTKTSLVLNI